MVLCRHSPAWVGLVPSAVAIGTGLPLGLFLGLSLAGEVDPCRTVLADLAEELLLGEVRVQAMQVRSADALDALARVLHRHFNQ